MAGRGALSANRTGRVARRTERQDKRGRSLLGHVVGQVEQLVRDVLRVVHDAHDVGAARGRVVGLGRADAVRDAGVGLVEAHGGVAQPVRRQRWRLRRGVRERVARRRRRAVVPVVRRQRRPPVDHLRQLLHVPRRPLLLLLRHRHLPPRDRALDVFRGLEFADFVRRVAHMEQRRVSRHVLLHFRLLLPFDAINKAVCAQLITIVRLDVLEREFLYGFDFLISQPPHLRLGQLVQILELHAVGFGQIGRRRGGRQQYRGVVSRGGQAHQERVRVLALECKVPASAMLPRLRDPATEHANIGEVRVRTQWRGQ